MTDVTKFINKETGEIHIGEVVIGPETKWEDIERLAPYAEVSGNERIKCVDFKNKLIAENIPVRVDLTLFSEKYALEKIPAVELNCLWPDEYDDPTKE